MNLDGAEKLAAMRTAHLIKTLNDHIQELEAMLESIGAGGVSAQRITQGKDHFAQDSKIAAPVVLPEPDEYQYRMKPNWDDKLPWTPWEACSKESAAIFRKLKEVHNWIYEVRERYTEQQVRELLATPNNLPAQALERSATHGMSLHQRILHVGGRENAQTYIEFGSVAAVRALVAQVLRDWSDSAHGFAVPAPQPQADARDAERYRWLRDPAIDPGLVIDKVVGETPLDEFGCGRYKHYEYRAGEELDDAIDAAIAAAKEK